MVSKKKFIDTEMDDTCNNFEDTCMAMINPYLFSSKTLINTWSDMYSFNIIITERRKPRLILYSKINKKKSLHEYESKRHVIQCVKLIRK